MGLENILAKNPTINQSTELAARKREGVENLYFNSDHSDSPVSGENGRYHEVDGKDRITVKGTKGEETVTAQEFVSSDKFSSFGSPQERLNLLSKASKYEIPNGKELKSADDLKEYVNSLKPPQKTVMDHPSSQEIARPLKGINKEKEANFEAAAKNGDLKASLVAKKDELQKRALERSSEVVTQKALEEAMKMNSEKLAEDTIKMTHDMIKDKAIQNFAKSPSLKTFADMAFVLMKY